MQRLVSFLLVGLLLACPYLCRADELVCCADHCEETQAPADDSQVPPLPANDPVSCICAGAVKDTTARVPAFDLAGLDLPPDLHFIATTLPIPQTWQLARDGAPPGRAARASLRVHLLLQNFRC
jgi:hypothetical protein